MLMRPARDKIVDRLGRARDVLFGRAARSSAALGRFLDLRIEGVIPAWIVVIMLAAIAKVVTAPNPPSSFAVAAMMSLPFLALAAAPVLGYRLAAGAFPRGRIADQPAIRLARYGSWRKAPRAQFERAFMAGPAGFLVSLLAGILLNVPVRTLEFLAVVPAINPADPGWAHVLVLAMGTDVVLLNFAYAVCFVMALRSNPLFPRALVATWLLDLAMQLAIARVMGASGLPAGLVDPLHSFLWGNCRKVLISAALWLPYLILSRQVNLLFRHRVRIHT